jgi:hypothetical protein
MPVDAGNIGKDHEPLKPATAAEILSHVVFRDQTRGFVRGKVISLNCQISQLIEQQMSTRWTGMRLEPDSNPWKTTPRKHLVRCIPPIIYSKLTLCTLVACLK